MSLVPWSADGWRGWIDPGADVDVPACLAAAAVAPGRRSRHAHTARVGAYWVKHYPAPGARRALRAYRLGEALRATGFGAPDVLAVGRRGGEGILVTRDAGGEDLLTALRRRARDRRAKRALLRALGSTVGRLHAAGFVHGDLVPPNVRVVGDGLVFLDNDRTRRSRVLVRLAGRRNLVQLGRFVVPGVSLTDRARVLGAYAAARGLTRATRRRLGQWVVRKTIARRARIDGIPAPTAARAGFRELMRSGGPFDPERVR
jgi:lipopolysaccharide kinase (Kdo/WaaP) family protein